MAPAPAIVVKENIFMQTCRIGLVSISDRAARGVYVDQGVPALEAWLNRALISPFSLETRLVPDEQPLNAARIGG